jgi:aspartyl aminopeptidase
MFDHEECGSESAQGAASSMMANTLRRLYSGMLSKDNISFMEEGYNRALKNSFLVSADMAHGVHPNYSEKHQNEHMAKVN